MKQKRTLKRIVLVWLVAAMAVFVLAGCRPSPALEQIVYTKDAKVVDVLRKKYEQDKRHEDTEENDDFNGEEAGDDSGDTDNENVNENGGGSASQQTNSLGQTAEGSGGSGQVQYSETGTAKETAKGTAKSGGKKKTKTKKQKTVKDGNGGLSEYQEEESKNNNTGTQDAPDDTTGDNNGNPGPADITDTNDDDDNSGSDNHPGGGNENNEQPDREKKVIDFGGIEQEVPVDVDTVAACDYAAQLVEMLGGSGRLLGADAQFTSNWLSAALFGDLGDVQTWWEYDGSYGITDAGLEALLAAKPEVVFEISGSATVDEGQLQYWKSLGIDYVVVPRPDSAEHLINGAKIIATVLGDNGYGGSAMSIAENYEAWIGQVKSEVYSGDSYVYSTFLSGWDDGALYTFGNAHYLELPQEAGVDEGGNGYGAAVAYSGSANVIFKEFWDAAGVTDEAARTGSSDVENEIYIMPMFHNLAATFLGLYGTYSDPSLAASADWGLVHNNGGGVEPTRVGDVPFTTIVAADNYTWQQITNSWYWQWHGYSQTKNGTFPYAYVPEGSSDVLWSSIAEEYDVVVNPSGLGSWITGSVDAPLEAYWAACAIRGDISLDDLYAKIASFYAQFYNVNLTDDEIAYILQGN